MGKTGQPGLSTAYAGDHTFPQVLSVPDDFGPIARIYLPAGKFVVFGSASFNNPASEEAFVECYLASPSGQESTWRWATLGPEVDGAGVAYDAATVAVQTIIGPAVAEYHYLKCTDHGGSAQVVSVPISEIAAIQVDTVRAGVAP